MTGQIIGTGACVPEKVINNQELEGLVETSDAWIQERTGIERRHIAVKETTVSMAAKAASEALKEAELPPEQIDLILVSTMSPEEIMPCTACQVQREIGASRAVCFDLSAACSGFVMAYVTACAYIEAGIFQNILVIGSECLSNVTDWSDRGTCILFGDGAGAAVVECREGWPSISSIMGCHGSGELLRLPGPGAGEPGLISMEGTRVFKFAVEAVPWCVDQVLKKTGRTVEDVDFFVFHQANARIIDLAVRKYRIPPEKYYKNIAEYGNTSAASIPLVLSELREQGKIGPGSRILAVGFGGGLTWGGCLIEFA